VTSGRRRYGQGRWYADPVPLGILALLAALALNIAFR